MAALFLASVCSEPGWGQVAQSAVRGDELISVGGTGSIYRDNYGARTLGGSSLFMDADWNKHYGLEVEGRRSFVGQRDGVQNSTYLIGPRYCLNGIGRLRPYLKLMIGDGQFRFPYNYADGNYLVIATGGGLDFRVNRRIRLRLIDAEYQQWPTFTYGMLSNYGVSAGIRVRIY
jgi:hypothetical protein